MSISRAIQDLKQGLPVVVADREDRENEVDLIMPAETLTTEWMAVFIRRCSGIVCLCLTDERLKQLSLPQMVSDNQSKYGTAFTVSIEAKVGVTTGVSAADRTQTVKVAIDENSQAEDLARPGHVFPLRAAKGGVLERAGHTEAAVELAKLAGFKPAAVLCELMHDDGRMVRLGECKDFVNEYSLSVVTIDQLSQFIQRPSQRVA